MQHVLCALHPSIRPERMGEWHITVAYSPQAAKQTQAQRGCTNPAYDWRGFMIWIHGVCDT